MELPINTVVILVMLLVLIVVVLILVSRGASNFTDIGEDKIGIAGDTSECEMLCWECCRGLTDSCDDGPVFQQDWRNCGCKKNRDGC